MQYLIQELTITTLPSAWALSNNSFLKVVSFVKPFELNDKTKNILVNYFGKEWADRYMTEVLFDEP